MFARESVFQRETRKAHSDKYEPQNKASEVTRRSMWIQPVTLAAAVRDTGNLNVSQPTDIELNQTFQNK
jgi:hypothetical protein